MSEKGESQRQIDVKEDNSNQPTILEAASTEYENERREANYILSSLKNPDELRVKSNLQSFFRKTGEPEIDWFNFETRIRKVIYDVVEPLTKKQFQTYDGFDDIKKQMAAMKTQQEETIARIDKVIRRNETFDRLDKYCREIEQELLTTKAVQKNDIASMLEKMETWAVRWKVTQNDVNNFHRYDDKIATVQKTFQDVFEEYKNQVIARFRDTHQEFMKQINNIEQAQRDQQLQFQEVLVKVQVVKDFSVNSELKFSQLARLIDDLRESVENSRFTFTYGHQQTEAKLHERISQLQSELQELRRTNIDIHAAMNPPPKITMEDVKHELVKTQIEMMEKVFASQPYFKKLMDFQHHFQTSYLFWRQQQLDKHPFISEELQELLNAQRPESFHSSSKKKRKTQSGELVSRKMSQHSKIPPFAHMRKNTLQPSSKGSLPFEESHYNVSALSQLQGIKEEVDDDQQHQQQEEQMALTNTSKSLQRENITKSQVTERNSGQEARNSVEMVEEKVPLTMHQEPLLREVEQQDYESYDDEEDSDSSGRRPRKQVFSEDIFEQTQQRLQAIFMTDEQVNALIQQQVTAAENKLIMKIEHVIKEMTRQGDQHGSTLHIIQKELQTQISTIGKQVDQTLNEFKLIKHNEGQMDQLKQAVQRSEMAVTFIKNDIQQQIYKLKEFDEQLYQRSVEVSEKLDMELVKLKRERSDLQLSIDKNAKEIKGLKLEDSQIIEMVQATAELTSAIVGVSLLESAVEQQDEIDRKQNCSSDYSSSPIPINGQLFQRSNLIHAIRVLLESAWQSTLPKQPYKVFYHQGYQQFLDNLTGNATQICQEFQQKIDMINQELERQNRGLPREIQKIKDQLEGQEQRRNSIRKSSLRKAEMQHLAMGSSRENLNKTADMVNAYESGDDRDGLRTRNMIAIRDKFNQTSTDGDGSKSPLSTKNHFLFQNDQSSDHLLSQLMPEISITKKSHNPSSPFQRNKMSQAFNSSIEEGIGIANLRNNMSMQKKLNKLDLPKQKLPLKGPALLNKNPNVSLPINLSLQFYRSISKLSRFQNNQSHLPRGLNDSVEELPASDSLILVPLKSSQMQLKHSDLSMDGNSYGGAIPRKNHQANLKLLKRP